MKTSFILLASLAAGQPVFAQGLFNASNVGASALISTNTFMGTSGALAPVAGSYDFAIFYSLTADNVLGVTAAQVPCAQGFTCGGFPIMALAFNDSNWQLATYATNIAVAGRLRGTAEDASGSTAIAGVAPGTTAYFVVLGWSANIGSTIQDVMANWAGPSTYFLIGQSAVSGPIQLGGGQLVSPSIWGLAPGGIPGFVLSPLPVPEPESLALGIIGAAAGWAWRSAARRRPSCWPSQGLKR